jgi:hypothetical protein
MKGGRERELRKKELYNLMVLKTLLTFKSMTFANALSGWVSNSSPHVAPAFANRISTWSVVLLTSLTSCSTPSILALSAGTEMALAPGWRFGRAFSALQAASQADALREVIYTLEAPAWRNLEPRLESGDCNFEGIGMGNWGEHTQMRHVSPGRESLQ